MRTFTVYAVVSISTVLLAFYEVSSQPHEPMHIYGFLAIFVCQPWFTIIWALIAAGAPIEDVPLGPPAIAGFCGLNIFLWGAILLVKHRRAIKNAKP